MALSELVEGHAMASSPVRHVRHLRRQLPGVAALVGVALAARRRRGTVPTLPGPEVCRTIAPLDPGLIRDYVEHVGGDPAAYRTTVPAHLFPQWGLALMTRVLAAAPYPLTRVLNASCRLEIRAALPLGRPLRARATLVSIDDDGRRATLTHRLITGTPEVPDALVATMRAVVPLAPRAAGTRRSRTGGELPYDATELARWRLGADAGLGFALLTGDFNPIHWVPRAGAAAGLGGTVLHGFSTFARAIEGLVRARFAGDHDRVRAWDGRFTRPLRLPADVALFSRADHAWVGEAHGGAPYLTLDLELSPRGTDD